MNANDDNRSLIPLPDGSLANTAAGAGRKMAAMIEETLLLARREAVARTDRLKIGDYEFCEPDFRQILLWAEALHLSGDEVIQRLLDQRNVNRITSIPFYHTLNETVFERGRIVKLNWNLDLLPISDFCWVEGLEIECLWIRSGDYMSKRENAPLLSVCPRLPKLRILDCSMVRIALLDLSLTPNLSAIILDCFNEKLVVPPLQHLQTLWCSDVDLVELDISKVPQLTELFLWHNRLTRLDLSHTPHLRKLQIFWGKLPELNVSNLKLLEDLYCFNNCLESLAFADHPQLSTVRCINNHLKRLDISQAPLLKTLNCSNNQLVEIDFSHTPRLQELQCDRNSIKVLDISPIESLRELSYDSAATRLIQRSDQKF